jgi:hypothetical protein
MKDRFPQVLRVIAIVLMGLVAAFDILGAIGTVCAAFFTKDFPPLWPFLDYQWIYQIFVFVTLAFGFAGVWVTRASPWGQASISEHFTCSRDWRRLLYNTCLYLFSHTRKGRANEYKLVLPYPDAAGLLAILFAKLAPACDVYKHR